ncbi:hypothetical protein BHM03_00050721 [Ensete ventricosum]|nr:hypothetical protein BHM03_00050721 [Ensete ventricosum]
MQHIDRTSFVHEVVAESRTIGGSDSGVVDNSDRQRTTAKAEEARSVTEEEFEAAGEIVDNGGKGRSCWRRTQREKSSTEGETSC